MKGKASEESAKSIEYKLALKDFDHGIQAFLGDESKAAIDYKDMDKDLNLIECDRQHPFDNLPHGYKALLNLYGTLFTAVYNQGIRRDTAKGLVLIDEPELHMHVALQEKIMPGLMSLFPRVQFVIATHSPFVLNSVKNSVKYDLDKPNRARGRKPGGTKSDNALSHLLTNPRTNH